MPNRVKRESGAPAKTVRLGISARRARVSSGVAIHLIIGGYFMPSRFPGFPPEAMQFFKNLSRNNNRDWFQPRKPIFEEKVKQPMRELVEALNGSLKSFAPAYVTDPDKAIYRFYRDTRFSKDKTPYKDHIAASFRRSGAGPHKEGGYYLQVSHKD